MADGPSWSDRQQAIFAETNATFRVAALLMRSYPRKRSVAPQHRAKAEDPQTAAEVLRGYHDLGPLKGNVGNQNYVIPSDIDVGEYASVAIWCELFDVLFSPATLTRL